MASRWRADADDDSELPAFRDVQEEVCAVSDSYRDDFAFRTAKEQKDIVERWRRACDILIARTGCFRRTSSFRTWALVVDEEQRFGVRHRSG